MQVSAKSFNFKTLCKYLKF